ncbi:MAG: hypothetical protein HZB26_01985 [Candidatus Hydrogenedentes bacterium]|nr:hypothetical protein [Candidatus Hydrogenedentota bacterium]
MPELPQQPDILVRLEAAVAEWNAQVSRAQQGLSDQLSRAKDRLDSVVHDLRDETVPEETTGLRGELESLELKNRALSEEAAALGDELKRLRQVYEERCSAQQEAERRAAHLERTAQQLREQVASLEVELAEARGASSRSGDSDSVTDTADHSLPNHTDTGDHGLPNQLAQALSDREEAHQEIVVLRAEIESLRRRSATPAEAAPQPSGVPEHIATAALDSRGHKRRTGDILVTAGVITQEQLDSALVEQETSRHRRLGEILVARGYTAEDLVAQVLASQVQAPFVLLNDATVELAAVRLINGRLASHHACIPIRITPEELTLAMSNPLDLIAIEDVELATNLRVTPVVATASDIADAIGRYYY